MLQETASPMDPDNPYSLLNLATSEIIQALDKLPTKYYRYSEHELVEIAKPSVEIARLRLNFWDEYMRAVDQQRKMNVLSITTGVCSAIYFYDIAIKKESWLAYITTPPPDYSLALREMLELGWSKLRKVLEFPITVQASLKYSEVDKETGKTSMHTKVVEVPNTRLISEMRAIVQMLDQRVKGAITQKMQIEQKNMNINVPGDNVFLADASMAQLEAMERKIDRMKAGMYEVESYHGNQEDALIAAESAENFASVKEGYYTRTADGPYLAEEAAPSSAAEDT